MSDTTEEGPGNLVAPVNDANDAPASTRHADIDPLLHDRFIPARNETGGRIPEACYASQLEGIKTRQPFLDVCAYFHIRHAKRDNLAKLRAALVRHWYSATSNGASSVAISEESSLRVNATPPSPSSNQRPHSTTEPSANALSHSRRRSASPQICTDTDEQLVQQYDVEHGLGHEIFGALDSGGLEEIGDDEDDSEEQDLSKDGAFKTFQTQTRVAAAQRWESSRRAGGRKTQKSVAKSWEILLPMRVCKGRFLTKS